MKKLSCVFCVLLIIVRCAITCFAATPTKDGTYEVSVEMIHKTEEKESMGNKYIAHTALLEIDGNRKFLTVALSSKVMKLKFSYFVDGSIDGDTLDAEEVNNVKIGSDTYEAGYRFPIVSDSNLVGVKFSAPIMPMSPTARIRIDYDSAVSVAAEAENTTNAPQTKPVESSSLASEPIADVTEEARVTSGPATQAQVATAQAVQTEPHTIQNVTSAVTQVAQTGTSLNRISSIEVTVKLGAVGWVLGAIILAVIVLIALYLCSDERRKVGDKLD